MNRTRISDFTCPLCHEIQKNSASLTKHFKRKHNITDIESLYIQHICKGVRPVCGCGCGEVTRWYGWAKGYVRFNLGHNGAIYDILPEEEARAIAERRASKIRGRTGWSHGLTKENSESLARAAKTRSNTVKEQFATGVRKQWSDGLTKETHDGLAKISKKLRAGHQSGQFKAWHKGLTKEISPGLQKMSESIRKTFQLNGHATKKRYSPEEITGMLSRVENLTLISGFESYTHYQRKNLIFKCNMCGTMQERSLISALTDRCNICCPHASKGQMEIANFIRTQGFPIIINDRSTITPHELDILIPSVGLAIEFNGLYWHSEKFCDREYHIKKTKACRRSGVKLFHVFEDEWRDKRHIVESMIKHRLGLSTRKIGARQCKIIKLSIADRRAFFTVSHIDGDTPASAAYGLIYENELIAAVSIRNPRQTKYAGMLEIGRFATLSGVTVVGGLSRLIHHVKRQYDQLIMTYIDVRHGDGASYLKAGFKLVSVTASRYWYTDDVNRYDRFKYKANKVYGLSEAQVVENAGVTKIWGCPNLVMFRD